MTNRKQLTFDIDTNVAKKIFGERNYTAVYYDIKSFMKNEGWIHIEGSVYMSSVPLSSVKVALLLNKLKSDYPYITKCVRDMHQSDIAGVHSLKSQFDYDGTAGEYEISQCQGENITVRNNRRKKCR